MEQFLSKLKSKLQRETSEPETEQADAPDQLDSVDPEPEPEDEGGRKFSLSRFGLNPYFPDRPN